MKRFTITFFSRLALFVVYFWFGLLKVLGESPANPLVSGLLERTLPFLTFDQFIVAFGFFEMFLGVLFLTGRFRRITVVLFSLHMIAVFLPLFLLPQIVWQRSWIPTLEGQYIIKNIVIIALYLNVYKKKMF
ncbi:MAG: hypothetical protein ABI430_02530 [Candidatus Taylorbacteria bacterium]